MNTVAELIKINTRLAVKKIEILVDYRMM